MGFEPSTGDTKYTKDLSGMLRKHYRIDDTRGGSRTTFRVNCLFGNRAALPSPSSFTMTHASSFLRATVLSKRQEHETCVIAHSWLNQVWGKEGFNNLRHPCCSNNLMRSSYNLSNIKALEAKGVRFALFRALESGEDSIDAMLAGSGGNALHAALTMCEHVDVYGTGLYSGGANEDKVYAHAYDEKVGVCLEPGSRVYEFGNLKGLNGFFNWRRDRVKQELLMHLMHAMGVIRWVQ